MSEHVQTRRLEAPDGKAQWIAPALALVLVAVAFWWNFRWMMVRWDAAGDYYSHGWLVPPVSLFLLWRKRRELAAAEARPWAWGWLLLGPSLLAHVFGTATQVGVVSGVALIGTLAGLVLTLFGPRVFRVALFPIAFLAFMVPMPALLIELFSFRLKLWAAQIAVGIGEMFGMVLARQGSYVHMPEGQLVVDDVCSGLKYLISLTAFGALYAHVSRAGRRGKALLFLLAVPVAFFANVLRVTIMVATAYVAGVETADAWYFHDAFGFALFVVAFIVLFGVEALLLKRREPDDEDSGDGEAGDDRPPAFAYGGLSRAACAAVLLPLALVAGLSVHMSRPREAAPVTEILEVIPYEVGEWQGRDIEVDERVYQVLGTRDVLARLYTDHRGRNVQLLVVVAQQMRRRTHPPEQCYAGGGHVLQARRVRRVPVALLGRDAMNVSELQMEGPRDNRLVWYFFKSGDSLNTSYMRHQAGVALRKVRDPHAADVLVSLDTMHGGEPDEEARQPLQDFLNSLAGPIERLP